MCACGNSSSNRQAARQQDRQRQQRLLATYQPPPQQSQQTMIYAQPVAQTSHSNPLGARRAQTPASIAPSLPLGWEERAHASGQSQYYNIRTKELTWVKPTATASAPTSAPSALTAPAPAARLVAASAPVTDLTAALKGAHLSQYEDALRELGCADVVDLAEMDEQDLVELGMKKIEVHFVRRLQYNGCGSPRFVYPNTHEFPLLLK